MSVDARGSLDPERKKAERDVREEPLHEEDRQAGPAGRAAASARRLPSRRRAHDVVERRRERGDPHGAVDNELRRQEEQDRRVELRLHRISHSPRALVGGVGEQEYREGTDEEPKGQAVALTEALGVGDNCEETVSALAPRGGAGGRDVLRARTPPVAQQDKKLATSCKVEGRIQRTGRARGGQTGSAAHVGLCEPLYDKADVARVHGDARGSSRGSGGGRKSDGAETKAGAKRRRERISGGSSDDEDANVGQAIVLAGEPLHSRAAELIVDRAEGRYSRSSSMRLLSQGRRRGACRRSEAKADPNEQRQRLARSGSSDSKAALRGSLPSLYARLGERARAGRRARGEREGRVHEGDELRRPAGGAEVKRWLCRTRLALCRERTRKSVPDLEAS